MVVRNMDKIISLMITAVMTVTSCSFKGENPLDGKRIAFIGDSISYGTNWQGGYGKLIGEQYSDGYRPYITDMLDNLDGDYEYIIAEGGLNDFWGHSELGEITDGFSGDFDENTMTGGMEKMFFEIKNDFPNAKVGFVITHDPFTYDAEGNFESYYERIKEVCDKWDVSYLDLYAKNNSDTGVNVRDDDMRKLYFGTESKPDGDGTHPNELGYQAIYVEPMIPWLKSL